MEPQEIWGLILKADDVLKYAKPGGEDRAREKASRYLSTALAASTAAGDAALAEQARIRLDDLALAGRHDEAP